MAETRLGVKGSSVRFCMVGEKEDEELYLYEQKCKNLRDLKLGWKPDGVVSHCGVLGELHDLPGRTWFRKLRPSETDTYTTDKDWKRLRAPWRHYLAFFTLWGPPGNLFYNMRVPMTIVFIVVMVNAIYATIDEVTENSLPPWFAEGSKSSSYSLTSFLVSLLLGFKVNRSYDRWQMARQNFTNLCARLSGLLTSISLAKLEQKTMSEEEKNAIHRAQRLLLALPFSMIMSLYSLDRCPLQIRSILDKEDIQWMESTKDAWYFLLCKIQVLISSLSTKKAADMEKDITQLRLDANTMFGIKRSHFPYFLSKIPTALIMVYTIVTPLQLFGDIMRFTTYNEEVKGKTVRNILHYWYLAIMILVLTSLVVAANEAADLLEDPYYYIPIHKIAEAELEKGSKLIQLVDPEYTDVYFTRSPPPDHEVEHSSESEEENDEETIKRTNSWFFKP